jgi:hypothetical protein
MVNTSAPAAIPYLATAARGPSSFHLAYIAQLEPTCNVIRHGLESTQRLHPCKTATSALRQPGEVQHPTSTHTLTIHSPLLLSSFNGILTNWG